MATRNRQTSSNVNNATETPKKKRMTVRVIASILIAQDAAAGTWERINHFELVSKEFSHNIALRKAVQKHKTETLKMVDENTVWAQGPDADGKPTATVYSVLRYSNQCPECGAPASKPNQWCDLCMSQQADEEVFDGDAALKALFSGEITEEEEEEEEA